MGRVANPLDCLPWWHSVRIGPPLQPRPGHQRPWTDTSSVWLIFVRVLVLSGFVEESVFRVLLQPPGTSLPTILGTNLLFVLYHLVMAVAAAKRFLDRPGVVRTFCDPTFLILTFVVGNLCSYSYRIIAQYGLWAPRCSSSPRHSRHHLVGLFGRRNRFCWPRSNK
jgi:membrane protease YdiL (CAAX protease family)